MGQGDMSPNIYEGGRKERVIVQNVSKISQTVFEISKFFDFQEAAIRRLGFLNFWSTIRFGGLMWIAVPNFTKIGQRVAEISCLAFVKMAAVRHLGFLKV